MIAAYILVQPLVVKVVRIVEAFTANVADISVTFTDKSMPFFIVFCFH